MDSIDLSPAITRGVGPLLLEGVRATTLRELSGRLRTLAGDGPIVASDLSLGSWRSHQVAAEFFDQLGLSLDEGVADPGGPGRGSPMTMADVIGAWIDVETKGDRDIQTALRLAATLLRAVRDKRPTLFAVLAPRFGLPWERTDVLFLRFLAEGLREGSSQLVLVGADAEAPALPWDWQVCWQGSPAPAPLPDHTRHIAEIGLVPGVVAHDLDILDAEADAPLVWRFGARASLVAPECRLPPGEAGRLCHDRLASRTTNDWLRGYAMYHGNNAYVDPHFLLGLGARRIAEGGEAIGLRLMERAAACASTPLQRGLIQARLQGLRIATRRFHEAVSADDPAPDLPASLRGILRMMEGWAVLMDGDPRRASTYLRQALDFLEPEIRGTREHLYLLNIYALSLLRTGDTRGAFGCEHDIERTREQRAVDDDRLAYVNLINLARLYRQEGDWERAAAYYDRAFATTRGVRSESDCIYTNACNARVAEGRGDREEAFRCWLRAALHWASALLPEALGSRVVSMLLGRPAGAEESLVEAVSAALLRRLLDAAGRPGAPEGDCEHGLGPAPVFTRLAPGRPIACAVGAPGWGVFLGDACTPPAIEGGNHSRLCRALSGILEDLCPAAGISRARAIFVDDRFGHEVPSTLAEMVLAGVRLRARRIVFGGRVLQLAPDELEALAGACVILLSPCVRGLETDGRGTLVTFRRILPPRLLSQAEDLVVRALEGGSCLGELRARLRTLGTSEEVEAVVRVLERDRVVTLTLEVEEDFAAGRATALAGA